MSEQAKRIVHLRTCAYKYGRRESSNTEDCPCYKPHSFRPADSGAFPMHCDDCGYSRESVNHTTAPEGEKMPQDAYIIVFDDTEREQEMFSGYGAEEAALKTFAVRKMHWNCHLFKRIDASPALTASAPVAQPIALLRKRIDWHENQASEAEATGHLESQYFHESKIKLYKDVIADLERNSAPAASQPQAAPQFSVKLRGELRIADFGMTGQILKMPNGDSVLLRIVERNGRPDAIFYRIQPAAVPAPEPAQSGTAQPEVKHMRLEP